VPKDIIEVLGATSRERINCAVSSVYRNSVGKPLVEMEKDVEAASEKMRAFMFDNVYFTKFARGEEEKAERMLFQMFNYFEKSPETLPQNYINLLDKYTLNQVICDYLSSMTDRYAVYLFNKIYVPKRWSFIDENGED
jgi:dGTPase